MIRTKRLQAFVRWVRRTASETHGSPSLLASIGSLSCSLVVPPLLFCAASVVPQDQLSQILDGMATHNEWQRNTLDEYEAQRLFSASNKRFNVHAKLNVTTIFQRPHSIESLVTAHEGSACIRKRVFHKILKAESETTGREAKQQIDITPANYVFTLMGEEVCENRKCFRLRISPRRKGKYSLDGEVWVDAEDYAIVRIKGSPSKRPSFWTRRTEIDRRYKRFGGIWLPYRFESASRILIFGRSTLSIVYSYNSLRTAK